MDTNEPVTICTDLERWMEKLPDTLRDTPIINLAIPGSHDSMTYGIENRSHAAPDAPAMISSINKVAPCVVRKWVTTQDYDVTGQLKNGVRFFDLRYSYTKSQRSYYFVHGLYCEEIHTPLHQLQAYLAVHNEFVIIDCQHFYDFVQANHVELANILKTIFGSMIYCPIDGQLSELTLTKAAELGKKVLIVYRHPHGSCAEFWSSPFWPTPWPNKVSVDKLERFLDDSLTMRPRSVGFVSQCVLTPTAKFIIPRFYSSLRTKCAEPVARHLMDWVQKQTPGVYDDGERPTSNVFLADYIGLKDSHFCKTVIELNQKIITQPISEDTVDKDERLY